VLAFPVFAGASPRAVVADGDVQLRAAIADSLKPWLIEVVPASDAPADMAAAAQLATDNNARYVIWRDGAEVVVVDREGDKVDRRAAPAGTLDAVAAAAVALSVKTMLRLPDLPPNQIVEKPKPKHVPPPVTNDQDGVELRVMALVGGRFEYGLDSNVALRFGGGFAIRPWRDAGWRFGAIGDGGASATVDQAGFHGRWNNWSLLALASWDAALADPWEFGPWIAVGLEHSTMSGTESGMARNEEQLSPALRGGVAARYRMPGWFVGGQLAIEGLLTNTTYTRLDSPAQVFEIPRIGAVLSLLVGVDFTP